MTKLTQTAADVITIVVLLVFILAPTLAIVLFQLAR